MKKEETIPEACDQILHQAKKSIDNWFKAIRDSWSKPKRKRKPRKKKK
mgnify:CR=1 FL=1